MNRKFPIGPVTILRFLADEAEQMAPHVHRIVAAVKAIANDVRAFYVDVVAPFVEWLKSMQACQPAKV
jgi:hypothetical protein